MSSKDKSCLSRELQPLPSDWWSILDLEKDPSHCESVKCACISILETDQGFLDEIEHLEAGIFSKVKVGFHSGPEFGIQAIHVEPTAYVLVDDLTRPVDQPAAVQGIVGSGMVDDGRQD
ncbi:hypothetical protein LCGC14_2608950, partial [marine sediment metagenome]